MFQKLCEFTNRTKEKPTHKSDITGYANDPTLNKEVAAKNPIPPAVVKKTRRMPMIKHREWDGIIANKRQLDNTWLQ